MTMLRSGMFAMVLIALPAVAQTLNVNFDAIAAKATSKAEIHLDGAALQAALGAIPGAERGKLPDIDAVSIHTYEFAKAGDYSTSDIDALRKQVAGDSRWSRLLSAREKDERADIFVMNQGGKMVGFLLIAVEPKEVAVIHATGSVNLAQLQEIVGSSIHYDLGQLVKAK